MYNMIIVWEITTHTKKVKCLVNLLTIGSEAIKLIKSPKLIAF